MTLLHEPLEKYFGDLRKEKIRVLQVNLGKLCNLTCSHCHVEAGPTKIKENMSAETAGLVLKKMHELQPEVLDLTGGAPEMNPQFNRFVIEAVRVGIHVIDRCNLTVLFEPGCETIAEFLAENEVEIIASLPCYSEENVDGQRGRGVFEDSIRALKVLNRLGYGKRLALNLVYNPVGVHLPPDQKILEREYKQRLKHDFGIEFNKLYAITNMPITRYEKYLKSTGHYEDYMNLLLKSYNPAALEGLMCRDTLSISWDGSLYDCDFNQMLGLNLGNGTTVTVKEDLKKMLNQPIQVGKHCFACTAGAGSSCQGALS